MPAECGHASAPECERRVAAVVLSSLLCEIARAPFPSSSAELGTSRQSVGHTSDRRPRKRTSARALAVVLREEGTQPDSAGPNEAADAPASDDTVKPTSVIAAANEAARRFGVREDQTVAEACALISELKVRSVTPGQIRAALARVADVARAFGPTVALQSPDTVLVDITGVAHLWNGEASLAVELASRVRGIGHVTRVAISSGPRLARAFAKWSTPSVGGEQAVVVERIETASRLADLPVSALPLEPECAAWLLRLGVLSIGQLAALPRAASTPRLGKNAASILDLCVGSDPEPLVPHDPPRVLVEHSTWDEGVDGNEALLFVLRGLAARTSARLAGRGEAARRLRLVIEGDPAIARLNGVSAEVELELELGTPLWREQELVRVIAARLERQRLETPSTGLRLEVDALTCAEGQQLDLSRVAAGLTACQGLEQLPVLVAELQADIGKERVGVLSLVDSLRPELKSALVPAFAARRRSARGSAKSGRATRPLPPETGWGISEQAARSVRTGWPTAPTRLLEKPLPLESALRVGATLAIEDRLYSIEHMEFEQRLEAVEWWTRSAVARDYFRLWLKGAQGGVEAIVYVDRNTGSRFLHAIAD